MGNESLTSSDTFAGLALPSFAGFSFFSFDCSFGREGSSWAGAPSNGLVESAASDILVSGRRGWCQSVGLRSKSWEVGGDASRGMEGHAEWG